MQRKENESFDAYKTRRAMSNLAVKLINHKAKGGSTSSRAHARSMRDNSKHAGQYDKTLRAHFANLRKAAIERAYRIGSGQMARSLA